MREIANCGDCKFGSVHDDDDELLACRRHAPTNIRLHGDLPIAQFPVVRYRDWCGDFEAETDGSSTAEKTPENRKILRMRAIIEATGWAKATIYAKIKAGKFPKPFKLDPGGRAVVWWEDDIARWQQNAVRSN